MSVKRFSLSALNGAINTEPQKCIFLLLENRFYYVLKSPAENMLVPTIFLFCRGACPWHKKMVVTLTEITSLTYRLLSRAQLSTVYIFGKIASLRFVRVSL